MTKDTFANIRKDYVTGQLNDDDVPACPFELFRDWFDSSVAAHIPEPNACALATVSSTGEPSCRMVLLKQYDKHGFVFFTNYKSRKGVEIDGNSKAAMVFFWQPLERQVRIEGTVQRVSNLESNEYFRSRPRNAQVSAIVSQQSELVASREIIDQKITDFDRVNKDIELQCPTNWGGFRVVPSYFEFWQGRSNRLHDRIRFVLTDSGWNQGRLWP